MPIPNKKLDQGCPCKTCSSQDEFVVEDPKPMEESRFQSIVLDWLITIDDKLEEIERSLNDK